MDNGRAIVVMGVSGCGKTSVAEGLAASLGYSFLEGDRLHPQASIDKMSKGVPLTDADRWPWLQRIGERLRDATASERGIVVSCSALKRSYRDCLRSAAGTGLSFVFLSGSRALLLERMGERKGHFMPASLLDSQLAALEDPSAEPDVVTVDIDATVTDVIAASLRELSALWEQRP